MRLPLTVQLILRIVGKMLSGRQVLGDAFPMAVRSLRAPDLCAGPALLGLVGFVNSYGLLPAERQIARRRRPADKACGSHAERLSSR